MFSDFDRKRVIKRFSILEFKWKYYLQRYHCYWTDCEWELLRELDKSNYERIKEILKIDRYAKV
jgi:hypothetical protein